MQLKGGAIIFGRVANLEISLDWTWLILLYIRAQNRNPHEYNNPAWWALDIGVFMAAVLLCDIAQIAACRWVGGRVTRLRLSFLNRGGDLMPPQRPTPVLLTYLASAVTWAFFTTAAAATVFAYHKGYLQISNPDVRNFVFFQAVMFVLLAIYTLLPAYPNDGGQILRSILWYFMGAAWSLRIAAAIGLLFVVGMAILAVYWGSLWTGVIAAMMAVSCINGFRTASLLAKIQGTARRSDYRCPKCGANPPEESRRMLCPNGHTFDFFACAGSCPTCGITYETAICVDCQVPSPPRSWAGPVGTFPVSPANTQTNDPMRQMIDVEGKPKEPEQR